MRALRAALPLLLSLGALACDDPPPVPDDAGPDDSTLEVRFEPEGDDFYRTPWPSDARLTDRGTPDLGGFPNRRRLLETTLREIEDHVHGYATMPVVYFALSRSVTDATLRQGVAATSPDSPIQLIDLSEEGCGERVPLEVAFAARGDALREDNLLQVANAIGTVLEPGRPYGAVLLRTFGAEDGRPLGRPAAFDAALAGTSGDPVAASLEPLRRCLPSAGVALDEVAVATVFTPQDPVAELRALRDFVADPARTEMRDVGDWRASEGWSRRRLDLRTFLGTVEMPIFQDGETPYELEGGRLVFDAAGEPVIQRWEEVDIAVAMRVPETPSTEPRPVLIWTDGTGWRPWRHLRSTLITQALDEGYVVVSFMPQFHGGRAGFDANTEIATFNIPNPPAGRSNFRQQAAETSYFIRVIRERIAGLTGLPPLDTDALVYGGHSQGALVGALVAAVEDQIAGFVLNGLSANLTQTILFREDILDFSSVVKTLYMFTGELDRFHPLLQMIQLGAEVVDPHNYGRRWHGDDALPGGNHVFVSSGYEDTTTTPRGIEHMTMAADMTPIAPPGWDVDPAGVWDVAPAPLPIAGNDEAFDGSRLTIATYLDFDQGHFTIYRRPFARQLASTFWRTARVGVPELASTNEFQCDDGADEDRDGMLDCADPDCAARAPCVETGALCDNGVDDDGDGDADCDDDGCSGHSTCVQRETECDDGADDDGDGDTDCDDSDCARAAACYEGACLDERDNDGDGLTDCEDPDCGQTNICPEPMCSDGTDENMNGLTDCADPSCAAMCAGPTETDCGDGLDDDSDGATDCGDADCALEASCAAATCADGDLGQQVGLALWTGELAGRASRFPPGDCAALGGGERTADISFAWTAPAAGEYVMSTYGSEMDTVLSVVAPDCDASTELACGDDDSRVRSSRLSITLEAGQSVVVVINAFDTDPDEVAGVAQLHIVPAP